MLDRQQAQLDLFWATTLADLDEYRDDWTSRYQEELRAHGERMQEIERHHRAEMDRIINGEPAPTHEPAQQGSAQDAPDIGVPAAPVLQVPAGRPDPYADDLAKADRIRGLSMRDYAKERERHIRPGQGMF
jgi:hypothetical protein